MEIYKITNVANGKCYIGQAVNGFSERYNFKGEGAERVLGYLEMRESKSSAYSKKLYHNNHLLYAIRKHGIENFNVDIIDKAETIQELNDKEIHWINYYDAHVNGYNNCEGGNGTTGWTPSEKTRKLWSAIRKGVHSGKNNPNYGAKLFTEETRQKMSNSRKGKLKGAENPKAKSVINLDTLEVFDTVTLASNKYNIDTFNIVHCCQRKQTSHGKQGTRIRAGGYRWMYHDEYLEKGDVIGDPRNKCHKSVINIDTGEIFNTTTEAGKNYSIDSSGIVKACKGKYKTAGGYRWEYYKQE